MWIHRDISSVIGQNHDLLQVFYGPRQCGKTSLLLRMDSTFEEVSLDDPNLRSLAQSDPELLLKQFVGKKIFIDEAQYAPGLFPLLKRRVDLAKRETPRREETLIRITGSNQILIDRNVKESLAGRASFFQMNTLSIHEILQAQSYSIQEILYRGGWPELYAYPEKQPHKYLDNYINSYVEKDIVLSAGIQKQNEFLKFIRLLAGRVGQILDLASLANDTGVDAKTIKDWVSILERMHLIVLVQPFFSNLSKRLIKSPKVYFLDTGLACRLQGWTSPTPIFTSPMQGALFENLVLAELVKWNMNYQLGWNFYHWRSRDGEEVDFVVQTSAHRDYFFLDAKMSFAKPDDLALYPEIRRVFKEKIPELYHCNVVGDRLLNRNIPVSKLGDFLKDRFFDPLS